MTKQAKFSIWYWVAAFVGLMIFQYIFITAQQIATIPYRRSES